MEGNKSELLEKKKGFANLKVQEEISLFINDLISSTDGIEYLDLDINCTHSKLIDNLLLGQKGVRNLFVKYKFDDLTATSSKKEKGKTNVILDEVGNTLLQGMASHESTLEKLSIAIENPFLFFKDLTNAFRNKEKIFPNLKSFDLFSTTAYWFWKIAVDHPKACSEDGNHASVLFSKMFGDDCQLKELNFRPRLELPLAHFGAPQWNPDIIRLLRGYIKKGVFSKLEKIGIDTLNSYGFKFPETVSQLLIKHCPAVTHIHSSIAFQYKNSPARQCYDDSQLIELADHYGEQLLYFYMPFITYNLATCIASRCPNILSIGIYDCHDTGLKSLSTGLVDSSLLSLATLKNLTSLKLVFNDTLIEIGNLRQFFQLILPSLRELCIIFKLETESHHAEILKGIQLHGGLIKVLHLELNVLARDQEYGIVMTGFENIVRSCQNLETIIFMVFLDDCFHKFEVSRQTFRFFSKSVTKLMISRSKKLRHLVITGGEGGQNEILMEKDKKTLIESMPFCRIELAEDSWEYKNTIR